MKYWLFLLVLVPTSIVGTVSFSNQASGIKINAGAKLIIDAPINNWNGTLFKDDYALVQGEPITFQEGIWHNGGTDALVNAVYSNVGNEVLLLGGDCRLRAEPGLVIPTVLVSGLNNSLEGQPLFAGPIIFDVPGSVLTVALQSKLNQDLALNNGMLILDDDLHFADNAAIVGAGTVDLNYKSIHFSPIDMSFTQTLLFKNATDLNLHSRVNLSSMWVFDGINIINGHGNVLDVLNGGKIVITPGSMLYISDVNLRGVANNSLIFENSLSQMHLSDVNVELASSISTTIGTIAIEGTTSFILRDLSWSFNQFGKLSVDGVTLWLDVNGLNPGFLNIPGALFINHQWNEAHAQEGIALGNFSLSNSGTVKEMGDFSLLFTATEDPCVLVRGPLTQDVVMQRNCDVGPLKKINIVNSITIDGQGARITFSDPNNPQFIIAPNITVRLINVSLLRITPQTFSIGDGATLEIDSNVIWELSDDLIFTGDQITVLGTFTNPNVFQIRGKDAQRRLVIKPIYQQTPTGPVVIKTFNIGYATVYLENIELIGLESIAFSQQTTPIGTFVGALALSNRSTVDIDVDTDMNFFIEGPGNQFLCMVSGLTLNGSIQWSPDYDSTLDISFHLGQSIQGNPTINIADNAIYLQSDNGRARLIFDDYAVNLNNLATNSFVADTFSFLSGRNMYLVSNPIKQNSIDFILDSSLILSADGINAVDTSFIRSPEPMRREKRIITALELLRKQNDKLILSKHAAKQKRHDNPAYQPTHKPTKPVQSGIAVKKQNKKNKKRSMDGAYVEIENFDNEVFRSTPIPQPPASAPQPIVCLQDMPAAGGIVQVSSPINTAGVTSSGTLTNFGVDPTAQLTLYMWGGATLLQGASDVSFKDTDILYVSGNNNKIVVTHTMQFNGIIVLDAGAQLTFEFDKNAENPAIILNTSSVSNNAIWDLPLNSSVEITGYGTLWLQDGKTIHMNGTSNKDRALFAMTNETTMRLSGETIPPTVAASSSVAFTGYGQVLIDTGATISIEGGQQLTFGASSQDNIQLLVDRSSLINVDAAGQEAQSLEARLSFQKAEYDINFRQNATLHVGEKAFFEINALQNTVASGNLTSLSFAHGGNFELDTDGTMIIGPNVPSTVNNSGTEKPFNFDARGGSIVGDGMVQLAATSFAGRILNFVFNKTLTSITAQSLVRALINKLPSLTFSTVFLDGDGNQWLFNKDVDLYNKYLYDLNTTIFKLFPGDEITGDNSANRYVYGYNNGVLFAILPNSSRR